MPQRTYGRMCGLARALELIGDRWTLLIVRQLLVAPQRYVDLLDSLPGLSTNLLADRLKRLESDGLITKAQIPPPAATAVYELTDYGQQIEPVVLELLRWGSRLLADPDRADEPADPNWPLFPIRWLARQHASSQPLSIDIDVEGLPQLRLRVDRHEATLRQEPSLDADLHIEASPGDLAAVFGGHVPLSHPDIELTGDHTWLAHALAIAYPDNQHKETT